MSLSLSSTENVVCGTSGIPDKSSGKGYPNFDSTDASDAIEKYCNGDFVYVSDPTNRVTIGDIDMMGPALDRFWYKNGVFCETTTPYHKVGGLKRGSSKQCGAPNDYEIDVGVTFKTDQTGCQPTKKINVPKGDECVNKLTKVISSCKRPIELEG